MGSLIIIVKDERTRPTCVPLVTFGSAHSQKSERLPGLEASAEHKSSHKRQPTQGLASAVT